MVCARATNSIVAALGLSLLAGPTFLAGQNALGPKVPTFRSRVEIIHLNVSVTDSQDRHVTGLSERDFAIFEDGVPQEITVFSHQDLPLSLSLLIDGSASMEENLATAQEAGVQFLGTLRTGDVAQIVQFTERVSVLQDFTSDQVSLVRALRSTRASGATALYTALYVALKELNGQGGPGELRRRAVVLLSDGEDTTSVVTDDQILDLARRTEIAVYAIGLRPRRVQGNGGSASNKAAHFLTALARDTGGQVYFPRAASELDGAYVRIAEELRTQYTLGYSPRNVRADGKWRRILVRPVSRGDLRIRHKIGYFAPRS